MSVAALIHRSRMGKKATEEEYPDWVCCSFNISGNLMCNITGSASTSAFDRVIVDGVELVMADNLQQTLNAGKHLIMWHPTSTSLAQNNLPQVAVDSYVTNVRTNLPASITNVAGFAMWGRPLGNCSVFVSRATTPPTCGNYSIALSAAMIYVPDESVNNYKAAAGWSQYADRIVGLSTL